MKRLLGFVALAAFCVTTQLVACDNKTYVNGDACADCVGVDSGDAASDTSGLPIGCGEGLCFTPHLCFYLSGCCGTSCGTINYGDLDDAGQPTCTAPGFQRLGDWNMDLDAGYYDGSSSAWTSPDGSVFPCPPDTPCYQACAPMSQPYCGSTAQCEMLDGAIDGDRCFGVCAP